ncbi:leucyl aminopeptidase family protein [Aestuariivirga sp.]|uniref:leucyl aminopeptidase family protein n=1 Tax=Aestuariivirga sp. TaxID=2650926 RepID=UPI0039E72276
MIDARKLLLPPGGAATPIHVVAKADWASFKAGLGEAAQGWARTHAYEAAPLALLVVPGKKGGAEAVIVGAPAERDDPFALGAIAARLPEGRYAFADKKAATLSVALGWAGELYKYDPFRTTKVKMAELVLPSKALADEAVMIANTIFAVRDQVNTPANLFGPDELERDARALAKSHKAKITVVSGAALEKGFPLIHAVGAASTRKPRLIDITWGKASDPKVTIVGKGVVFDTGGLDIKPSSSMLLMKKDMGGAANVLGLARLIMEAGLKVRLRVLVPAVENAIAGDAFRPGDIFKSRKGLTVEIGNTDAEGRLILADALALADEEKPELLLDMATLTGAARVATGPDLPPFFTDDETLAADLSRHAFAVNDPLWRLPLWRAYFSMIETPLADLNNAGAGGFAGSITAALFLRRFVEAAKAYVHFDIFAWTPTAKPGRPKGGEAQALRAVFALLKERYGK